MTHFESAMSMDMGVNSIHNTWRPVLKDVTVAPGLGLIYLPLEIRLLTPDQ
ncbi:MAG: hypothetical protein ACMUIA_00635 [bacterium]